MNFAMMKMTTVAVFILAILSIQFNEVLSGDEDCCNRSEWSTRAKAYAAKTKKNIRDKRAMRSRVCTNDLIDSIDDLQRIVILEFNGCTMLSPTSMKKEDEKKKCFVESENRFRMRVDLWVAREEECSKYGS